MTSQNVLTLLPPSARRIIYLMYGILALIGSAATAAYAALPQYEVPPALTAALAVLGVLAAPIGVLAASNTDLNGSGQAAGGTAQI